MIQKQISRKVAFVTGGSRGIGRATQERFKKEGWWVAVCATQEKNLVDSSADLKVICDVSQKDQVQNCIQEIIKKTGKIDVIVNNAGLSGTNSMNPIDSDEMWHEIIDVNLNGTYYVCKEALQYLPDNSGRIINIASILALRGVPDAIAYCAAKHAVLGFTRALAHYLAPRKITVNTVCPGWVSTDMANSRISEIGIPQQTLESSVPLGRFIQPAEVADFIYFIASSEASAMITGQALTIDGGALA